jgi:O-succinylbenzoic acid--CoA ligase
VWSEDEDLSRGPALGATHIAVVRTQLQRYDLTGYDAVLVGGAKPPMMRDTNTIATWGMTETGSGVVYDGYALPGVEMTILDGEFCVRTPTLFTKYRESDRPVRVDENGLEWFPTGDGGSIADGKLSISGRLQYVINTGGEKVWPEDLESLWSSIEGVRDVAAVGVDDPEWGQRIVALVVTDGRNVDEKLKGFAHEHIGPWAKPKEIRYVAALPRTSNGKIRRSELQHLF